LNHLASLHCFLKLLPLIVLASGTLSGRDFRVNQIPNGQVSACQTCHLSSDGGGSRNDFGRLVNRRFLVGGNVKWNPLLASRDADGDGVANGAELQDRYGRWILGQPSPGNPSLVSRPGDPGSVPLSDLSIVFAEMAPFLGLPLEVRVIDKSTGQEAGRNRQSITAAVFQLKLGVLETGQSYQVDLFIDASGNGLYDPPPADAAWRLQVDKVDGFTNLLFTPDAAMTDIGWVFGLNVQFSGMDAFDDKLLELRVIDRYTHNEVGRARLEFIKKAEFRLTLPVLSYGRDYQLDIYADANSDGLYQAPPADRAWRIGLPPVAGNATVQFTPDLPESDIGWKYRLNLNCLGMFTNLGKPCEFRAIDLGEGCEVSRARVDEILTEDFTASLLDIRPGIDYRLDLYADTNRNGRYNPPPIDGAWRTQFRATTGDAVLNVEAATAQTDIQWPALTAAFFPRLEYQPNQWTDGYGGFYQGSYDAVYRLTAYNQFAQVIGATGEMTWPRGTQRAEQVESLFGLTEAGSGWVLLETNQPGLRSFFLTQRFDEGLVGLDGAASFDAATGTGILPRVKMLGDFTTTLYLCNPSSTMTMVTIQGFDGARSYFGGNFLMPPRSLFIRDLAALFPAKFDGAVEIAAEEAIIANATIQANNASIASLDLQSPLDADTTLYAAHLVGFPDVYYSELNLFNPAYAPITVNLTVYQADGTLYAGPFPAGLPARQVLILQNADLGLPNGVDFEGWLKVEAPIPVYGCLTFAQPAEHRYMTTLALQHLPRQELYFAQVANGNVGGVDFFTGIAVVNPFDAGIEITIRIYDSDGRLLGEATRPLGPREKYVRLLQFIEGIGDLPDQSSGYIHLTATGPVFAFALFGDEPLNFLSAVPAPP